METTIMNKTAQMVYKKAYAMSFHRFGIRCNAVVPGFIRSPMTDAVPEKVLQKIIPFIAMHRMGKPEGECHMFQSRDRGKIGRNSPEVGK